MKNKYKIGIGIVVGAIVSIITLIGLAIIFLLIALFGGPTQKTTDIAKYEATLKKYPNIQTGFISFPETLPASATDTDFYFSFKDTWDDPTCEVFLQCTYDEKDYLAEVKRLENTKKQYGSEERCLLRGEEGRFKYPAYIAIDADDYAYEYALLTGDRQITYIYTAFMEEAYLKKIESQYLPGDYDRKQNEMQFGEGYSIYLSKADDYGLSYNYDREEKVEVLNSHWVNIGYNFFAVDTSLDEEDNEIIQYCEYNYYESSFDSFFGTTERIVYNELKGYRFGAIELNEDQTKAIVTYYDGSEEKKMEYEIPEV